MQYQLILKDGSTVDLSFSLYFVNRICKLSNVGFQQVFNYLLGDISRLDEGIANGGFFDDMEIRAQVLAAASEAAGFAKGEYKQQTMIEGFQIQEQIPNSLFSPVWIEIGMMLVKALIPEGLPVEPAKKKAAPKRIKK